ncbi:MAG: proteasome assembly chaperone 4 family protein [Tepidanaerobacteraceae bacterium]|jgi:hypothetical protein|nr:proteasome assembly chaperone 4 family protein [Tepidanaerobacteraceae bacterium]
MIEMFFERYGKAKFCLQAVVARSEDGINVYVGGGEKPHIGTVVLSQPRPSLKGDGSISCTTSVINIPGHMDDIVAVPMAEEICKRMNCAVVVTCGIHVDDAAKEEIDELIRNGRELTRIIAKSLEKPKKTSADPKD